MSNAVNRFLGGSPLGVIIRLAILSLIVGMIMSALNWSALDIWSAVRDFFHQIWMLGFEAFGRFGQYVALGAAVVVPIFLVMRILRWRKAD